MTLSDAKSYTRWLFVWAILLWALPHFVYDYFPFGKDDSDSKDSRSGMHVHIDHATQCEYLSTPSGGITPRMTVRGQQRGCV